jgi:Holin of 3TMs, for gene-transfer release
MPDDKVQKWWRPALGWVGVAAFFYATLVLHAINFALRLVNAFYNKSIPMMETPDLGLMVEVMVMVLGLGYLRTSEKLKSSTTPTTGETP